MEIFRKGYRKTLKIDDLYSPISCDQSKILGDRLERKWMQHMRWSQETKKPPSLLKVLVFTFWPEYLYLGIILVGMDLGIRLTMPLMLGQLLDYFGPNNSVSKNKAILLACGTVGLNALNVLFINQYIINSFHYGMKLRVACSTLIYRKLLRLNQAALVDTSTGKILNLLSNDVSRFDMISAFIHHIWVAPTLALIVTCLLYVEAGYAGVIGVIPTFLVVSLQSYTGRLSAKYRKQGAKRTDERISLMNEIISGVQLIKMYAWEKPFTKLIKLARKAELDALTKSSYVRGLFMTFNLLTTRASLFFSLLTMALTGQEITAPRVFALMLYFTVLSQTMSSMFVRGITESAETLVAIKRIQEFLLKEEVVYNKDSDKTNTKIALSLHNLTVKWNLESSNFALRNIDLTLENQKFLGVIGPVGSGKSSLLQTLLGELHVITGTCKINGRISYASQEPWIFFATVRQNILFGERYDQKRYKKVVKVCALEKDFKQFSEGDLTVVGDRGASLSGGQKARINLARAVYREADIYLLDDPLSSVDTHVAKHLYEECITGYLAKKMRILVTHQVNYLENANEIIILNHGKIEHRGTYHYLAQNNLLYTDLLASETVKILKTLYTFEPRRKMSAKSTSTLNSSVSHSSLDNLLKDDLVEDKDIETKVTNLQEHSSKSKIRSSLFLQYLAAGGNFCLVSMVIILFLLTQTAVSSVDYFVSFWTNLEEFRNISVSISNSSDVVFSANELSTKWCLYVYAGLIGALFVFGLARSILFYKMTMLSSQKLHDKLFHSVINVAMRFFNTNSSGRILNRFTKDVSAIDEVLSKSVLDAGQILLNILGFIFLVTVVNPYFLIVVATLGIFFMLLRSIFLRSSKNIKRLEGIMRSPVFTHVTATSQGLISIRAFGAQDILRKEFDNYQDQHTGAWFMFACASSAFGFYLDFLCLIFTTFVIFSFLTFGENLGLKGGEVGLAITQSAALTGILQWGMRQTAEITNQLVSVERVLEYTDLPPEEQPQKPKTLPQHWPNQGKIIFKELGLRYHVDEDLVLKDLSINIQPKEKIGIVGRTGAGKSSLIAALFRLANVVGEVQIDGMDTKEINLQVLRSNIAIIPQDPVLFSETLRYNLDPLKEYPDELLCNALRKVELEDISNKLQNRVIGSNYSLGQRQLICLARAIIKNSTILVLDEATANVDFRTDMIIQKTIREKFADCTVLTVAHRLTTIMDSDKVLVMESGRMVEFDHPYKLLQNQKSVFYKMVADMGQMMADQMERVAKETYQKRFAPAK